MQTDNTIFIHQTLEKQYRKWNILLGWFVFFIAFITYSITVEPTVSFWDAGEYIATASKLGVSHPPGAPLLQMIGAFFAMFALETTDVAKMVNYVSVVSSAFTILFLFWTITNLIKKLVSKEVLNSSGVIAILGSGIVGSLTFTYSDSFWFNATETEVYSMASLIMALLLWLGLKWTDNLDTARGNKWLLLIAFVVGLTFGVQFMGFLAIPSIGLLYYFRRYKKTTIKNFLLANMVSVGILMLVFKFSLTYVLKLFGWSEVFFVNTIGLPFNSGNILMGILFVLIFYTTLRYTHKNGYKNATTIVLCVLFLFLGFSSWIMLPLRASANVVINENNPSDARSLLAYFNREQYPSVASPFYGAYYSDTFAGSGSKKDDKPKYERDNEQGRYRIVNDYKDALVEPSEKHIGLLPRMWSSESAENYMKYYGFLEFKINSEYRTNKELRLAVDQFRKRVEQGEVEAVGYIKFLNEFSAYIEVQPPTLQQNIEYLFSFQLGYMYWRYFMWNFVGRQDDTQGHYDAHGNWLSGINFLDNLRLGSQENLPSEIENNKGRNTYFFLPLLLGLIGVFFQLMKNPKQFWVLLVFFLFTGLAIQFYTNPPIFQVRERDYSLVGSFYVFSLWIGIGVYGLYAEFKKVIRSKITAPLLVVICFFSIPLVMATQNWDDHDRSNRYTAQAMAKAYMDSIQENVGAIIFTIGDNDTFPLWYIQEVEEYRTDVRVIATTYFSTDWNIDQMKRKTYNSEAIPSQLTHDKYSYGTRDGIYYRKATDKRWAIKDFMNWVGSDAPQTKFRHIFQKQGADLSQYPESTLDIVYYPTNKIRIPVNKKNVLQSGLVKENDADLIVDYIDIDLPTGALSKGRILMLDIIANNDWKRPIYFSGGSFDDAEYIWMKDYLQLDGLAYKLVPIKTKYTGGIDKGRIDTTLSYDIVKKWDWGNSGDPRVYIDSQTRRQGISYRLSLARLSEALLLEGKIEKAKDILDLAMNKMPITSFGYYAFVEAFLDGYYKVGDTQKARVVFQQLKTICKERLHYYATIPLDEQYRNIEAIISDMEAYQRIVDILIKNKDKKLAEKETSIFNSHLEDFEHFFREE